MILRRSAPLLGLKTGKYLRVKLDNCCPIDTREPTFNSASNQLPCPRENADRSFGLFVPRLFRLNRVHPRESRGNFISMETSLRVGDIRLFLQNSFFKKKRSSLSSLFLIFHATSFITILQKCKSFSQMFDVQKRTDFSIGNQYFFKLNVLLFVSVYLRIARRIFFFDQT